MITCVYILQEVNKMRSGKNGLLFIENNENCVIQKKYRENFGRYDWILTICFRSDEQRHSFQLLNVRGRHMPGASVVPDFLLIQQIQFNSPSIIASCHFPSDQESLKNNGFFYVHNHLTWQMCV